MGHKGADQHNGAAGARRAHDAVALHDRLREGSEDAFENCARGYVPEAIRTLLRVMRETGGGAAAAAARVTAAKTILEYGLGKPTQRIIHGGRGGPGGLTINIVRLTDGKQERVQLPAAQAARVQQLEAGDE